MDNPFLKDSIVFLKVVSTGIKEELSNTERINLIMNLAFGVERLLKAILFKINPTYVLINPEFKNSLPIFYNELIIPEATGLKELNSCPDEDVITYRNSLLRAQLVSETTYNNKALLFNISNFRDIIAHHMLDKLDYETLKTLLLRDYYPLIKSFCKELDIKQSIVFQGKHIQLAKLSSKLQDTIEKQIELRFEALRSTLRIMESRPGYMEDKQAVTKETFNKGDKFLHKCPCCENQALIYAKPIYEFNAYEKAEIKIGYSIKKLKCFFCKTEIEDYKELDFLGITIPSITPDDEILKCSRCGESLSNINASTGLCEKCDEYYNKEN